MFVMFEQARSAVPTFGCAARSVGYREYGPSVDENTEHALIRRRVDGKQSRGEKFDAKAVWNLRFLSRGSRSSAVRLR